MEHNNKKIINHQNVDCVEVIDFPDVLNLLINAVHVISSAKIIKVDEDGQATESEPPEADSIMTDTSILLGKYVPIVKPATYDYSRAIQFCHENQELVEAVMSFSKSPNAEGTNHGRF